MSGKLKVNWRWFVMPGVVFATPWVHRLAFDNLNAAIHGLEASTAHGIAGGLSFMAAFIVCFSFMGP
jgi:hypothetical protein